MADAVEVVVAEEEIMVVEEDDLMLFSTTGTCIDTMAYHEFVPCRFGHNNFKYIELQTDTLPIPTWKQTVQRNNKIEHSWQLVVKFKLVAQS